MQAAALRRRLLAWYDANARDLPWRRAPYHDPYAIWVSEVMLQQTRVDVVIPYFQRWMKRFPDVVRLSAASDEEVLRQWSGLGYYRRARNLHRAACDVAHGEMPRTAIGLAALPGVGAYTAAAIASMAFGEPVAAIDGNVTRVVARLAGLRGDTRSRATRRRIEQAAQSWLAPQRPGDWNQAMMDLGATVCTPKGPRCADCPVAKLCVARATGMQDRIPRTNRRAAAKVERRHYAVVESERGVLLVRGGEQGLLAGLWSLPGGPAATPLASTVRHQAQHAVRLVGPAAEVQHEFTHRIWSMRVRRARVVGRAPAGPSDRWKWAPREGLAHEALSVAMRKAIAALPPRGR